MKWIRPVAPRAFTKNNLNPYAYFFNKQNDDEENKNEDTPITDEGIQNVLDAAIDKENKTPSIKISYEEIPIEFFEKLIDQKFLDWMSDSQVRNKFLLKQHIKNRKSVPCLLFEDFDTTGIKGDWKIDDPILNDGGRNDYNIFFYFLGNPVDKGDGAGGGVGVGRLTFAFSSLINTFFTFSSRADNSKFFKGMTALGKSKKNPSYDQFARYGVEAKADDGSDITYPITGEKELKEIHKNFKLKRSFTQSGSSMIIPFPVPALTRDNLIMNAIERYRYAFLQGKLNFMQVLNLEIKKEIMLDTINRVNQKEYKRHKEYFKFLEECEDIKKNQFFKTIEIKKNSNPAKIKKEHFNEDVIDEMAKDYNSGKIISLKVPIELTKVIDDEKIEDKKLVSIDTHFKIFLKKTEMGLGMDDVIRGSMPVSDFRCLDYQDSFALVLIDEKEAHEFYKKAEPPNHRIFEKTEELENSYTKYQHQILILKSAVSCLKNIIEDRESEVTDTATQGIFTWSGGDESGKSVTKKGVKTTKEVSKWIFENPKGYDIVKLSDPKRKMHGLKIKSTDFKQECLNRIIKIKDILSDEKYRKTKKIEEQLNNQIKKLEKWSEGGDLETLFPAKINIKCAQDIEGQSYAKIFDHHDKNLDFDFSNKISNNIIEKKEGDIIDVEMGINEIDLSINGPNFEYSFLFDASTNQVTGDSYDLIYESNLQRLKYNKE